MPHQSIAIQDGINLEATRSFAQDARCGVKQLWQGCPIRLPSWREGKPPRECFVIQLEEARAEWKRRKEPGGP